MRDFLYSEISQIEGIPNIPDYPDRAIEAGRQLCELLLEPLQDRFGRICIRSAYRAPAVNAKGAENKTNIVAPQTRATTVGIFGITWIPTAIWVRPLVLWCRRCLPGMRAAGLDAAGLVDSRQFAIRQPILVSQTGGVQFTVEREPEHAALYNHLCGKPAYWR